MNMRSRKYYRISFVLASSLNIGASESIYTDKDMIKDARGIPYIPASSLAGVCMGFFKETEDYKKWFGTIGTNGDNQNSCIRFYDAQAKEDTAVLGRRDSVALDKYRTAKPGAKMDREVVEPGAQFVTYIEVNCPEDETDPGYGDSIASLWSSEKIVIGGKTGRGSGRICDVQIRTAGFDLADKDSCCRWLKFDMYDDDDPEWSAAAELTSADALLNECSMRKIRMHLQQKGGISIRTYTTELAETGDSAKKNNPDFRQLRSKVRENGELKDGDPVIPGTAWAGVFYHRMEQNLSEEEITDCFGKLSQKTAIRFSESHIAGGTDMTFTRTAINRVTGGAQGSGLYTEVTCYDGNTDLEVDFLKLPEPKTLRAFASACADLDAGFLAVGGLSSIGRGLFRIEKLEIDDQERKLSGSMGTMEHARSVYEAICNAGRQEDKTHE